MWKHKDGVIISFVKVGVSVPLRGLIMWKPSQKISNRKRSKLCFSPLTGINYVETSAGGISTKSYFSFSPLTGINYVETGVLV